MTIMKNGYENQVSAATMAPNAVLGLDSQLRPLILNSALKTWLMVPCSRKKNCQTSAIRMASDDAAHGMNNSTRKKVRPGKKLLFRISASVRPSIKLSG